MLSIRSKFIIYVECTGVNFKHQCGKSYTPRKTRPIPTTVYWDTGGREENWKRDKGAND